MKTLLTLACVLMAAPAFAQNPCAAALAHAVLPASGVNRFFAELPDHNATEPDGTPRTVAYQYGAWPEGANPAIVPPSQGPTTIPKTAFVPVSTGCYELTGGLPGLVPTAGRMFSGLRAQAQPGAPAPFSAWGTSNSFSLASVRMTPAAPGQVRIQP